MIFMLKNFKFKKINLIRNQLIISEIARVSQMFEDYNRYVFIKGAASLMHFSNIRPLRDIDIDVLINQMILKTS